MTSKQNILDGIRKNVRHDIVSNMHQAYEKVAGSEYIYGCFISGPSKTADIAQALVMGAQAAREVIVLIQ